MSKFHSIIFPLILFIFASCTNTLNKKAYLRNFHSFVDDVEVEYRNYDHDDWKQVDSVFYLYSETYYQTHKDKLSSNEKDGIDQLIGMYNGYRMKGKIYLYKDDIKEQVEKTINRVKGFSDALQSAPDSLSKIDSIPLE